MSEEQKMIKLLLVTDSLNQAEDWAQSVRQKGYAIQELRVESLEDIETAIAEQALDLVIVADGLEHAKINDITHHIAQSEKDVPCLVVTSETDKTQGASLFKEAVQAVILYQETDRLVFAVARELTNLETRRQVRKLKVSLQESKQREALLLENSEKAIAYIHEGMHVSANQAYLTLFAYQDEQALAGLPLLDMVAAAEQDALKKQFRTFSEALSEEELQLDLQCVRSDGSEFTSQLILRHARLDNEDCIQVSCSPATAASAATKAPVTEEKKASPEPVVLSDQEERAEWKKRLQTALEEDNFKLLYQPIVGLHGKKQVMYQVLLRFVDGAGVLKEPAEFLAVAKAAGLIIDIDKWLVNHALAILAAQETAKDTLFFIQLSEKMMSSQQAIAWLQTTLSAHQVAGSQIVFEVGEAFAMKHIEEARTFIAALKEVGSLFCLQGFGAGPDLPRSLHSLDVDFFKINGAFVNNMVANDRSQKSVKIIAETIKLAGKVGIAEQVADAQSMAMLWGFGVHYAQGDYMQLPSDQMHYDFESE